MGKRRGGPIGFGGCSAIPTPRSPSGCRTTPSRSGAESLPPSRRRPRFGVADPNARYGWTGWAGCRILISANADACICIHLDVCTSALHPVVADAGPQGSETEGSILMEDERPFDLFADFGKVGVLRHECWCPRGARARGSTLEQGRRTAHGRLAAGSKSAASPPAALRPCRRPCASAVWTAQQTALRFGLDPTRRLHFGPQAG